MRWDALIKLHIKLDTASMPQCSRSQFISLPIMAGLFEVMALCIMDTAKNVAREYRAGIVYVKRDTLAPSRNYCVVSFSPI